MSSLKPRVVLVSRQTEFDGLLASHGTRGQAEFFLKSRGQNLEELEHRHIQQVVAIDEAKRVVPSDWSMAQVQRGDLDRFLFGPNDIVVAIGQDGLVANLAKYVDGQPIVGISPDPENSEGVLTSIPVDFLSDVLQFTAAKKTKIERRSMVEASIGKSQKLVALNELFIGHKSHQSARYILRVNEQEEYQSSSGVIVATGTGLTGWAKSIMAASNMVVNFSPQDSRAVYFAREPWPSRTSGCELRNGEIDGQNSISITSQINEGGVIFADGIEQDFMKFDWGLKATIALSKRTLNLVSV